MAYLIFTFVWSPTGEDNYFGITLTAAALAAISAVYGGVVYRFIKKKSPTNASLLGFLLYATAVAMLVYETKDQGAQFYTLWILAILISGIYGWFILALTTIATFAFLSLVANETITAAESYTDAMIFVSALTSVMSYALWRNSQTDPIIKKGDKKKAKKASTEDIRNKLSSEILIDAIADGVVIVSDEGVITEFNPSAEKITGWSKEEAISLDHRSVLILSDVDDKPYTDESNPISTTMQTGEIVINNDAKLQTKTKKGLDIDLIISPIEAEDGSIPSVIVIFRDVSQQRSEERQRAEFISTASHEMRTPVAAIEGYLALAMNDKVSKIDSTAKSYLDKAHSSTQHLGKLFQDLLTAAKSEDGRLASHPVVIETGAFLDEIIDAVRFTAEKKGLVLESDFGGGSTSTGVQDATIREGGPQVVRPVAYIHADPDRLQEVITNLFDNAIKYTEEGKVTIGMRTDEKNVTITVADTGAGIPAEDIPHLFQKFYRVDNTATRQIGGTGLGLFISRKIIELYQGKIWVESELNKGSTFFVQIPRLSAEKAREMLKREASAAAQQASPVAQPTEATTPQPGQTVEAQAPAPQNTDPEQPVVHVVDATKDGPDAN